MNKKNNLLNSTNKSNNIVSKNYTTNKNRRISLPTKKAYETNAAKMKSDNKIIDYSTNKNLGSSKKPMLNKNEIENNKINKESTNSNHKLIEISKQNDSTINNIKFCESVTKPKKIYFDFTIKMNIIEKILW